MSKTIVLKKGLDLPVAGEAGLELAKASIPQTVAVQPSDFKGLIPRLLVKEGDRVLAGSPVLADKKNPDILFTSPVSGTVKEVVRGDKRKLIAVLIESDGKQESHPFGKKEVAGMTPAEIKAAVLASGLWPNLIQRPYGIIADPAVSPKAVFVSAFSSAPLAADTEYTLSDQFDYIQCGIKAVARLTEAKVYVGVKDSASCFAKLQGCEVNVFKGPHPAGNVGVQISQISPIRKGETVWTISMQALASIGKLFIEGRYDVTRKVAVTGPACVKPEYIETVPGMPMAELEKYAGADSQCTRFVSGDILCGRNAGLSGYLGFADTQVTLVHEGTEQELFGWARPFRLNQFSADHSYPHWCLKPLLGKRTYKMSTNLHGGPRAFVMNDSYYSKYLPMDIYPLYLIKACLAGDIDKMEKFGIYEVLPEDLALCEYIDPSKNYIQDIIAQGIDLMLKEMA